MKKLYLFITLSILLGLITTSCVKTVTSPNMPSSYENRTVVDQGTIYVSNRNVTIRAWDSGTIDGDIITLVLNGKVILSNYTLEGPDNKKEIKAKLDNNGYNYILLYAHNEGSIAPNTAALSIDDGTGEQNLVLSSDMQTCGAMSIYVQ